jgi:hypothetical protein
MQSPKEASMMLLLLIALFSLLPLPVLAAVEIAGYYSKPRR